MADFFDDDTDDEQTVEDFGVKCPYCGHIRTDDLYDYEEGGSYRLVCGSCDKTFKMRLYVTTTYMSEKIPEKTTALSVRDQEDSKEIGNG